MPSRLFNRWFKSVNKDVSITTQEQLKQLVLDCISAQRESEVSRASYDIKSSLYALSSVYSLVESHSLSAELTMSESLSEFINLMYDFQRRYRENPLDSDEYGGGGAVVGSVISTVIHRAEKVGIQLQEPV